MRVVGSHGSLHLKVFKVICNWSSFSYPASTYIYSVHFQDGYTRGNIGPRNASHDNCQKPQARSPLGTLAAKVVRTQTLQIHQEDTWSSTAPTKKNPNIQTVGRTSGPSKKRCMVDNVKWKTQQYTPCCFLYSVPPPQILHHRIVCFGRLCTLNISNFNQLNLWCLLNLPWCASQMLHVWNIYQAISPCSCDRWDHLPMFFR